MTLGKSKEFRCIDMLILTSAIKLTSELLSLMSKTARSMRFGLQVCSLSFASVKDFSFYQRFIVDVHANLRNYCCSQFPEKRISFSFLTKYYRGHECRQRCLGDARHLKSRFQRCYHSNVNIFQRHAESQTIFYFLFCIIKNDAIQFTSIYKTLNYNF